jgi:hypothetical protein
MCSVPQTYGTEFRMADTQKILGDIEKLDRYLFLVNDNLHLAKRRVRPFYDGLAGTGKKWCGLAPLSIAEDTAYLDLLKSTNCWAMYIDLSPWISAGLNEKIGAAQIEKANLLLERIRDRDIKIIASFVFGFDHDKQDVFERTVRFAKGSGIEEAEFHILTPYPKSRLYERLEAEGRLITRDFSRYATSSVVYRPANMTPGDLYEGYLSAWRDFYPAETHEMSERGFVIKAHACFPMSREELDGFGGAGWVEAVTKKNKTEVDA